MSTMNMLQAVARKRVTGGGFVPTDIAGCMLWLDASQIVGLSDSDPVASWADESGNGNDVTASGAARPTYKTGILNGKPVIRFNGSGNGMDLTSPLAGNTRTTFIVFNRTGRSGAYCTMLASGSTGGGGDTFALLSNAPSDLIGAYDTADRASSAASSSTYCQVTYRLDSGWSFWKDGSSIGTTAAALGFLFTGGFIGKDQYNDYHQGDIAEVIMYDSALGPTDRTTVESYLQTKWGL